MLKTENTLMETFIVQNEGNIVSDMDGEKVMLSIKKGKYYNLGEVGSVIWDLIESPISASELIKVLLSKFNVEEQECKQHVYSFLDQLYREGLIDIKEGL